LNRNSLRPRPRQSSAFEHDECACSLLVDRNECPVRIAWAMADQSETRHEIRDDGISRSDLVDCDAQSS
jgi:hypothetical protein